jgi:hypothetical protein
MHMTSVLHSVLGANWENLAPTLVAHHRAGHTTENGLLSIAFPACMRPVLWVLGALGALLSRSGDKLPTTVEKRTEGDRQFWHRRIVFPDGTTKVFNSQWQVAGPGRINEWINPLLGLQMTAQVVNGELHCEGVCYLVKLGPLTFRLPEWLVLGHLVIRERALDDTRFAMDFWLQHPLFGRVYRYFGVFEVRA